MEETTTKSELTQEFKIELKKKINKMIAGKRELLTFPQDNLVSEEVKDQDKIKSAQDITKTNQEIAALENALLRVDGKTFGICIDCSDDIPQKRLEAYPTTERCTSCKVKHEKRN